MNIVSGAPVIGLEDIPAESSNTWRDDDLAILYLARTLRRISMQGRESEIDCIIAKGAESVFKGLAQIASKAPQFDRSELARFLEDVDDAEEELDF